VQNQQQQQRAQQQEQNQQQQQHAQQQQQERLSQQHQQQLIEQQNVAAATTRRMNMAQTCFGAVNNGYQEGFRAGEADRQDRWHSDYRDSYAYRDANYGYSGYYLAQDDYN
jgi:hypothetical protein